MAEFDPDEFLKGGTAIADPPPFDPDAFLAQDSKPFDPDEFLKTPTAQADPVSTPGVLPTPAGGSIPAVQPATGTQPTNRLTPEEQAQYDEALAATEAGRDAIFGPGSIVGGNLYAMKLWAEEQARKENEGPLIKLELPYPENLKPGVPQEFSPTSNAATNAAREAAGGVAGGVADIVGGAAGFFAEPGRQMKRDIDVFQKRIDEISKKPSAFDDFSKEQLEQMSEAPEGYRTAAEEREIQTKRLAIENMRGVLQGERDLQLRAEDMQKLASAASEESQTFFGQDPKRQDEFLSHLAQGAGSLPPYIASAMVGGPGLSMIVGSLQTGQGAYNEALASGHPELASKAFENGLKIGMTEAVGVGGGTSEVAKTYGKKALAVLMKGFEEGGQEWVQNTLSNLNASTFTGYDENRPVFKGSGEAALIGFLLGGGVEGVSQAVGGKSDKQTPSLPPAAETPPATGTESTEPKRTAPPATVQGLVIARDRLREGFNDQPAFIQMARNQSIDEIDAQLLEFPREDVLAAEEAVRASRQASAPPTTETPPVAAASPPASTETSAGGPSTDDAVNTPIAQEQETPSAPAVAPEVSPSTNLAIVGESPVSPDQSPTTQAAADLSETATVAAESSPLAAAEAAKLAADVAAVDQQQQRSLSESKAESLLASLDDEPTQKPDKAIDTKKADALLASLEDEPAPAPASTTAPAAATGLVAAAEETAPTPSPAPSAKGKSRLKYRDDSFTNHPVIQYLQGSVGGILSKSAAKAKWSEEKFAQNSELWEDAPRMANPTHNKIYNPTGLSPEEAVGPLIDQGFLPENANVHDLWRLIGEVSEGAVKQDRQIREEQARVAASEKQSKQFVRAAFKADPGEEAIAVSDLKVDDEIDIDGEKLVVTAIDPDTGEVTMKDGRRFGIQTIDGEQVIYGEITKTTEADPLADWPEIDTPVQAAEYAFKEGLDEDQSPVESPQGSPAAGIDNIQGSEGADQPVATAAEPATQEVAPETPLARARRVLAARREEQQIAREEGDYELAASLGRVIPKLERDLAAMENPATTTESAPSAPTEKVEMWQRPRSAVGTQLKEHREAVKAAVAEKLPVPDEVLAEYDGFAWADKEMRRRRQEAKKAAKTTSEAPKSVTPLDRDKIAAMTDDELASRLGALRIFVQDKLESGDVADPSAMENVARLYAEARNRDLVDPEPVIDAYIERTGASLPKLREGQSEAELLQGDNAPFNLVSETAEDKAARLKREQAEEKERADKEAAEAKALQEKQQQNLFDEPTKSKEPDKIEQYLEKLAEDLKTKPGEFFSDPLFIQSVGKPALRAAVKVILATYRAGKNFAAAIEEGIAYLKANAAGEFDEQQARTFFEENLAQDEPASPAEAPESTPETAPEPTPAPETTAPPPSPGEPGPLPDTTATYNAETDKLLEASGFAPIAKAARQALTTAWDAAVAQATQDPKKGSRLVSELIENPRTLVDDIESGVLLHELATRKAEQAAAQSALFDAVKSGDEAAIADAQARLSRARDATYEAITAAKLTGTAWGRAGRFRQVHIDQDFSLVAMEAAWRSEANGGKPLSADQAKMIAEMHARIEAAEKRIQEFEAKEAEAEAKRIYDQVLKEAKKEASEAKKTGGNRVVNFLNDQAEKARARIIARRSRLMATIDPINVAGLIDETIIGASYIAKGVTKLADWSAAMIKDFGERIRPVIVSLFEQSKDYHASISKEIDNASGRKERPKKTPEQVLAQVKPGDALDSRKVFELARAHVNAGVGAQGGVDGMNEIISAVHKDLEPMIDGLTERQVRDAFTDYGKVTYPSKEEDLVTLREARNLGRLASQLEDALSGKPPKKTGPQRDKATQAIRDLTKQVKETMRRMGIQTNTPERQLKTSLDAVKTRLQNQIEDLIQQIKTKTKPDRKTPVPYDDEAKALREERDRLMGIAEEIFGKPEMTDAQRIAAANKALDKAIAEEDALLKAGILKRPSKESKTPMTPELEAKRSMLDAMRDLRAKLREAANPKKSPEEAALDAALKAAKESIARYDEMLKSGNLKTEEKAARFTPSSELETLWNERNAMREAVQQLRREAMPRTSKEEQARKAALKSLDKRLAELDRRLRDGDFSASTKTPGKASAFADVQAKRAEVAAVRALYDELKKATLPKRSPEEIQLARDKKLIAARTAELQRRVREGDYAPKLKKDPVMDKEKQDLLFENAKAKEAFNRAIFNEKLKQRGPVKKAFDFAVDLLGFFRALKVGLDDSAIGRQGRWVLEAHPFLAAKAIGPHIRAAMSESAELAEYNSIMDRPNAKNGLYAQSKVQFANPGETNLSKIEEEYQSRWIKALPKGTIIGPLLRGAQRAFNTYMNHVRANMFDALVQTHTNNVATLSPEEIRQYGKMVNVATGKGDLGGKYGHAVEAAIPFSNMFLFATRFYISRVQAVLGEPLWGGTPATRKIIATEYARMIAGKILYYSIMGTLAGLATGSDDRDDDGIIWNPKSANFGSVKINNTYVNPWAGMQQFLTFFTRLATGEKMDSKGKIVSLRGDKRKKNDDDVDKVIMRFIESKRSPNAALIHDILRQKHYGNVPLTGSTLAEQTISPLVVRDTAEILKDNGFGVGSALWGMMMLGESMKVHEKKPAKNSDFKF